MRSGAASPGFSRRCSDSAGEPGCERKLLPPRIVVRGGTMDALASIDPASVAARVDIRDAYERHRHDVFRLALRYGAGRRAWAEDVTQEVFVRLMEIVDRLDAPSDLGAWLYRVTANHCVS